MLSDRLGVITFFGILVPGAYLAGVLGLAVYSILDFTGHQYHALTIEFASKNLGLFTGIFLFLSYLLGVLVRLFAPNYVDTLSKYYLIYIKRKSEKDWVKDDFPYEVSLTSRLKEDGMAKVLDLMRSLNPTFGEKKNNVFFNYCKWFIYANEPALSRQVQDAEALVRFLSGTTLVLLVASLISSIILIVSLICKVASYALFCGLLFAIATMGLVLILERFKYQRRREVIMVWSCVYMIVNGGTSSRYSLDPDRKAEAVFFTIC